MGFLPGLLWAEGFCRLGPQSAVQNLVSFAASGSYVPCPVTWVVHPRQKSSVWFSGSQTASALHSKSQCCGRKHEMRTSGVCLMEMCLRHGRPSAGDPQVLLCLCLSVCICTGWNKPVCMDWAGKRITCRLSLGWRQEEWELKSSSSLICLIQHPC